MRGKPNIWKNRMRGKPNIKVKLKICGKKCKLNKYKGRMRDKPNI
jgi:hypothetical protein